MPFVCPRKREHSGAAAGERRSNLPGERRSLRVLAVSNTIEPDFGEYEWTVGRQIVKTFQISIESRL